MMSVIIPVKEGNQDYRELVYALRSLEKNLKGFGEVFIVGNKINALRGLNYISCKDDKGGKWKERNIYRKILKAIDDPRVTDNFCFMNDDHMLTKEFNVETLPYYHKNDLADTMANNKGDYRKSLNHSRKFLIQNDKPTLDFDTHFPIVYNKDKFLSTFVHQGLDWNREFGFVIKSVFCNFLNITGEFGGDCKIHHSMRYEEIKNKIGSKEFFSTSDKCMNADMIKYLDELYPTKSQFER